MEAQRRNSLLPIDSGAVFPTRFKRAPSSTTKGHLLSSPAADDGDDDDDDDEAACDVEIEDGDDGDSLTRGPQRSRLFRRAKVRSLRMTAVIVFAFIVCWTPYEIVLMIHLIARIDFIEQRYTSWIFFFGMTNSMVNPLIYGAFTVAWKGKHR